jgi:hypothetical protein
MNAGLGTLTELKAQLLAAALRDGDDYDDQLLAIGLGVAAMFDRRCSRHLGYDAAATFVCSANRDHCYVDRYPVISVSKTELKTDHTTGYVEQTSLIEVSDFASGYLYWGSPVYGDEASLRFTFAGGFWFDTTEGGGGSLPTGATPLPDDLKWAWYLQCQEAWNKRDKLGLGIAAGQDKQPSLTGLELVPQVKQILTWYFRYAMA